MPSWSILIGLTLALHLAGPVFARPTLLVNKPGRKVYVRESVNADFPQPFELQVTVAR